VSTTLPSKSSAAYAAIRENVLPLTRGIVLVVDPSIGSQSSLPGWAVYGGGDSLLDSGVIPMDVTESRPYRLRAVYDKLENLTTAWQPHVIVYEEVPVMAHAGRSQVSHASLLNAVGVTLAATHLPGVGYVGIQPIVWKKRVSADYVKGDEADAIEMGQIVIAMAHEILLKDPPRKYRTAREGGDEA